MLPFGTRTVSLNVDSVSYLRVVSEMGSVSGTDPVLSLPTCRVSLKSFVSYFVVDLRGLQEPDRAF